MKKNHVLSLFLAVLTLASLFAAWQPAQASPAALSWPLKIMPFGDSITSSVSHTTVHQTDVAAQASYRYWLDHDLHAAGIPFEFIGTQINNYNGPPKYLDFDRHNEGHSGYGTFNLLDSGDANYIDTLLSANSNGTNVPNVPDIVLMHLGSVDIATPGHDAISQITGNLGILIDRFRVKNPKVIILVAQIIPCTTTNFYKIPQDRSFCSKIPGLNSAIPALVALKNTADSPVYVVDQYTGINASTDTYDGEHPNQSGEQKMATKWLAAIQNWWNARFPNRGFLPIVLK
jgi:lysophospholipase L1-like esterase